MEVKLKKALTVANVINKRIKLIEFSDVDPELYNAFGDPQDRGVWFIWGGSGSGKSSLALGITKAFCYKTTALHNELEEEVDDYDFIQRLKLKNMQDVQGNFWTASYNYEELCAFLDKRNSPKVVVINSATYFFEGGIQQYFEFTRRYKRRKIIIILGMAQGKNPYSELEKRIMYDANKKIFCDGYLASCKGRTIGPNGGTYIIWQEGYERLRGSENDEND